MNDVKENNKNDELTEKEKLSEIIKKNNRLVAQQELIDKFKDNKTTYKFLMEHKIVEYKTNKYVVIKSNSEKKNNLFVIDHDDFDKIKVINWVLTNGYVSCGVTYRRAKVTIYLHNIIMDKITFDGKGQSGSIDHINRITLDNRKINLRVATQSNQNLNQNKQIRKLKLPTNSNIEKNDIPRGVSYIPEFKDHGDGFEVYVYAFNDGILKYYSSRDKTLSLRFKLEQVKKFLRYTKDKFPEEFAKHHIETTYNKIETDLIDDYNEIIKLSEFANYTDNLVTYNTKNYLTENIVDLTDQEKQILKKLQFDAKTRKKLITNLPENCGITSDMIPMYCYYAKQNKKSHDGFVIDGHPKMEATSWSITNKKYTLQEKLELLKGKINELENLP